MDNINKSFQDLKATLYANNNDLAELIVRYLEHAGVECAFGIPGGAIEPLFNALARSERRNAIRTVISRHEAGAAFMADGYTRETGKIAICMATSGPGATNLITGVACAYENKIPMLVVTGQPAITSFGKGALQESSCTGINIVSMFEHCTNYSSLVSHKNQLTAKLANALLMAYQSQGPVHLSIPVDILRKPVDSIYIDFNIIEKLTRRIAMVDEDSIDQLWQLLRNTDEQPVFFIGTGATGAIDSIMRLLAITDAVFITTPDAKGLINPLHKSYRGVFGLGGHSSAADTLRNSQGYNIAFGASFGELGSNGWSDILLNDQLIHLDDSDNNLFRTPMARLHVKGDILTTCDRLIEKLMSTSEFTTHFDQPVNSKKNPKVIFQEPDKFNSDTTPIKPQRLMKELSKLFPPNTRFLADAGNSMMWAPHYLQPNNRREKQTINPSDLTKNRRSGYGNWLRLTVDFAPMGWAIGAAIGVAKANPVCPTVCITGDGAYLMSGQEITVAIQEGLCVIYVILNDSAYGMVKHGQRKAKAEPIGHKLPAIDFKKQAESMGILAYTIESPKDFEAIDIESLLNCQGPSILDVRVDSEEVPPMDLRMESLGSLQAPKLEQEY